MNKQSTFPRRLSTDELRFTDTAASLREVEKTSGEIIESIRLGGEEALRHWSMKLDQIPPDTQIFLDTDDLKRSWDQLEPDDQRRFEAVKKRIKHFAEAQKACLSRLDTPVQGGHAGHEITPVANVGCYVPSGTYPLPSSALMTVIPARVAGVSSVWIASPKPDRYLLAAAYVAGADGALVAGGAQAIAALAVGVGPIPASDVIVGPGNQYVTAAKKLMAGAVRIDMLAGPSELVIIADDSADPAKIAADLLAQAEHDEMAVPVFISLDRALIGVVEKELDTQLLDLPTRSTAIKALQNGGSLFAPDLEAACGMSDLMAPEHLQVCTREPANAKRFLNHFGALFLGEWTGEVFGDYGAGPNHVLPTGRTARTSAGLSVMTFLRLQTWISLDPNDEAYNRVADDSAWLARIEGLEAHARAAETRIRAE